MIIQDAVELILRNSPEAAIGSKAKIDRTIFLGDGQAFRQRLHVVDQSQKHARALRLQFGKWRIEGVVRALRR